MLWPRRRCEPTEIAAPDATELAAPDATEPTEPACGLVGRTTGDADDLARVFLDAGVALIGVDYRGYGWSTGSPAVGALCKDAEAVLDAVVAGRVPGVAAGCAVVCWGRSIGALSAVHLAAYRPGVVRGVFVDSGLMSLAALPVVRQAASGMLGPSAGDLLSKLPDPASASFGATTLHKAQTLACPALVARRPSGIAAPRLRDDLRDDDARSMSPTLRRGGAAAAPRRRRHGYQRRGVVATAPNAAKSIENGRRRAEFGRARRSTATGTTSSRTRKGASATSSWARPTKSF